MTTEEPGYTLRVTGPAERQLHRLPGGATLVAFAAASIVFVAIPGPNLLYIVGHGISRGRRSALAERLAGFL